MTEATLALGTRFRATCDLPLTALIQHRAPVTGDRAVVFPHGELLEIASEPHESATLVYVRPVHYRRLEKHLLPRRERWWPTYAGFVLVIERNQLGDGVHTVRVSRHEP
jgi:hypothetical protein